MCTLINYQRYFDTNKPFYIKALAQLANTYVRGKLVRCTADHTMPKPSINTDEKEEKYNIEVTITKCSDEKEKHHFKKEASVVLTAGALGEVCQQAVQGALEFLGMDFLKEDLSDDSSEESSDKDEQDDSDEKS